MSKPLAVMPTYMKSPEDAQTTAAALNTLHATADVDIMVVDDGSPHREAVTAIGRLVAELGGGFISKFSRDGYSATVNVGLMAALERSQDALLVDADIRFIQQGWLEAMQQSGGDVVGARLLLPQGPIQHAGIYYSLITRRFVERYKLSPYNLPLALESCVCPVSGSLQLITIDTLRETGVYDPALKLGWGDVDYCLRAFADGRVCRYEPSALAIHHERAFRGADDDWSDESWMHLHKKYDNYNFSEHVPLMLVDNG